MLTRDDIELIRAMDQNGVGQREAARRTGHSRDTIRKYAHSEGFPSRPTFNRPSKLDPYKELVRGWLESQEDLSGKEIWQRLREEHGFTGSYQTVQRYVHALRYGR